MNSPGIYIHIPFCRSKCPYCDFCSRPPQCDAEVDAYVEAVIAEATLRAVADPADAEPADTVYVGGGTPSLIGSERPARMLDAVRASFGIADGAEITIEANPLDVTSRWAAGCLDAGINRISIGVQSVIEDDLRFLGRAHRAPGGPLAVETARDVGFEEIGVDLIYGLPKQTPAMLRDRLTLAIEACRPTHVSCYQLTIHEGTPLHADLRSRRIAEPDEETQLALFRCVHEALAELGYPAYEVSNFSLHGEHRSRHNSRYWAGAPYVGLGVAAHSFLPPSVTGPSRPRAAPVRDGVESEPVCGQGGRDTGGDSASRAVDGATVRSWNTESIENYIASMRAGRPAEAGREELSAEQLADERVLLALRTSDGLDLAAYRQLTGRDLAARNREVIDRAVADGLLVLAGDRLIPTVDGLAVADRLAAELE
jgi:oxygen-independent coproporphyrinogen-3 oxidase